jgi:hypothetical protein
VFLVGVRRGPVVAGAILVFLTLKIAEVTDIIAAFAAAAIVARASRWRLRPTPSSRSVQMRSVRTAAPGLLIVAALASPVAAQEARPSATIATAAAATPAQGLPLPVRAPAATAGAPRANWFDLQAAAASIRYRGVENVNDVWTTSAMQWTYNAKGRVLLDARARYTVNFLVLAGASFNQSWLMTGLGTGTTHYESGLRQLYVQADPIKGLSLQAGSLAPARGLSTEITTLDNDGWVFGERIALKGRTPWFADEIVVTNAYLGQFNHPDLFHRTGNWGDRNYQQVMATRALSKAVSVSGDYTHQAGSDTLHQAVLVSAPKRLWFNAVRFEQYERVEPTTAYGMAASLEKSLTKKLKTAIGWASVDRRFGTLNGERFNTGHRWFVSGSHPLAGPLSVSWFYTRQIDAQAGATNAQRVDLHLTYDVLAHARQLATR